MNTAQIAEARTLVREVRSAINALDKFLKSLEDASEPTPAPEAPSGDIPQEVRAAWASALETYTQPGTPAPAHRLAFADDQLTVYVAAGRPLEWFKRNRSGLSGLMVKLAPPTFLAIEADPGETLTEPKGDAPPPPEADEPREVVPDASGEEPEPEPQPATARWSENPLKAKLRNMLTDAGVARFRIAPGRGDYAHYVMAEEKYAALILGLQGVTVRRKGIPKRRPSGSSLGDFVVVFPEPDAQPREHNAPLFLTAPSGEGA